MKKIKRKTNLKFTQKRHLLPILILYILILACAALPAVHMEQYLWLFTSFIGAFSRCGFLCIRIAFAKMHSIWKCKLEICERCAVVKFIVKVKNRSILVFPVRSAMYVSDLFGNDDAVRTTSLTLGSYEQGN